MDRENQKKHSGFISQVAKGVAKSKLQNFNV